MSKLKKEVAALVDKMQDGISVAKDGVATVNDSLFEDNLPEGISMKTVAEVENYKMNFGAAAQHVWGKKVVDVMAKNADLHEASVKIPMTKNSRYEMTIYDKKDYINRLSGTNETVTQYGVTVTRLVDNAGRANIGPMGAVRSEIREYAKEKFKSRAIK